MTAEQQPNLWDDFDPPRPRPTEREVMMCAALADPASVPVYADWLEEHGDGAEAALVRGGRMSVEYGDRVALTCLLNCRFLPGSQAKRFVRGLGITVREETKSITIRQRAYLWRLVWSYRKQIGERSPLVRVAKFIREGMP